MKKILLLTISILFLINSNAQNVGIGTNTPKELSKLDVESSTTGFLLPRMTTAQRATLGGNISALGAALSIQYNGMMVYDMTNNTLYMWDSNKTDFTNGGWNNVLDADASVADNDADPNNEIQDLSLSGNTLSLSGDASTVNLTPYVNTDNQDLSLSGNTLSLTNDASTVNLAPYLDNTDDQKVDVFSLSGNTLNLSLESDGEATKTVDLAPLKDHDWYESTGTTQADNISDNIYTQGNVAIGTTNAFSKLDVRGNALIGSSFTPNATTTTTNILNMVVGSTDVGNENGISFYENANFGMSLGYDGLGTGALNALRFYNNSFNPIVTIENGGEVGINTTAPAAQLEVNGDSRLSGENSKIEFDTKELNNGWTLQYRDEFQTGTDGWVKDNANDAMNRSIVTPGNYMLTNCCSNTTNHRNSIFKKSYDLTGVSHTNVMIKFTYCFIDSWDGGNDVGSLSAHTVDGVGYVVWTQGHDADNGNPVTADFFGGSWEDACTSGEATFYHTSNTLWLRFGSYLNDNPNDESFAIDNVEIWVR